MWPFDHPGEEPRVPQIGGPMHQPLDNSPEARIRALEEYCARLEMCIHQLAQAVAITQEVSNQNFTAMGWMFEKLVRYVMTPRKSIMGDGQEKN